MLTFSTKCDKFVAHLCLYNKNIIDLISIRHKCHGHTRVIMTGPFSYL